MPHVALTESPPVECAEVRPGSWNGWVNAAFTTEQLRAMLDLYTKEAILTSYRFHGHAGRKDHVTITVEDTDPDTWKQGPDGLWELGYTWDEVA